MQKFSKDKRLKCPEPILLIIGGNPKDTWNVSAFVFLADKDYVPLLPILEKVKSDPQIRQRKPFSDANE